MGMQKFVSSCLADAAKAIESAKSSGLDIKFKARNDKATSADFASERLIANRIGKEYPDSVILSEESYTRSDVEADSLFVIDPIDGTHNFIQGIPLYGISIAHYSKGEPTAGGVYFIPQKALFYAEKGGKALMDGKEIKVSGTERLEDFFMLSDSRLHVVEEQGMLPPMLRLEKMSQHTRFIGSTVYDICYVACGVVDACLQFKVKPYDFAAAAFIAEMAGAKVTGFDGNGWGLSTTKLLISNGRQHGRILRILNGKE